MNRREKMYVYEILITNCSNDPMLDESKVSRTVIYR